MPIDTKGFRDTRKEEAQKNFTDSLKSGRFGRVYRDVKGVIHTYDKYGLNPLEYFDARQIAKESPIEYSIERDFSEPTVKDINDYDEASSLRRGRAMIDDWSKLKARLDQERKEEAARREAKGLPLTDEEKFLGLRDPGKTRINDITLSIPPEQINIQTSVKNVSVATLRSHATQKIRTGHGYVQISLPLVFTS